jgi:diguanylate cyclase (GGDEF)-like protein
MSRRTNAWSFFVLALVSGVLCAQEYSFRNFGTAEGLNNLGVRTIYQDRSGFIWVSTENGIFRYDGERFEAFGPEQGIPSTNGAAFGDAPDGSVLAGGSFGLYHLTGNRFEKLPSSFKTISIFQGIQADGKGHTYLGTDTGLVELYTEPGHDGFAKRRIPQAQGSTGPGVYGVLVDGEIVWYGCGGEICRMDSHRTTVLGRASGLAEREWQVIRKDGQGNLWVRGRNVGIYELEAGQSVFKKPDSPILSAALGGVPAVDMDGRILLPSADGLFIQHGKEWQKVDRTAGLRGTVYAILEDRQHSLWIGTAGRGLVQWRGYREWESYSAASGLGSDVVYEILPLANGTIWLATEGGLVRGVKGDFNVQWKRFAGVSNISVHSLQMDPGGDLWIGTEAHGVARIHIATGRVEWFGEKQGMTGKDAYTLHFDRDHRLWAATETGLLVARPPYQRFTRIEEIPPSRMWAIAEGKDGALWAGGAGGLYEYTGGQWRNWTRADGLSNLEVLSLAAGSDGTVWVGYRYGGGIDRIHPKPGGITIEKGVERPGSNGLVYFLEFDREGRLWAGTEKGVDMWNGARWDHFDTTDGLAWNDCDLNAFAEDADGAVWIGTSGGVSRFRLRAYSSPDAPLDVVFTRLMMEERDVSGLRNPSFGSSDSSLTARYYAPNAPHENDIVFRYRLEGAQTSWTETRQRELQFVHLAPGVYRLDVEAQNDLDMWGGHPAVFAFKILAPWYGTWWFIVLCALIPPSLVLVVLRLRVLSARRREHELMRLVDEKTADLQRTNEELERLSFTDALTGLANRRIFDQTLEKECSRMTRTGSPLSLIIFDADHFKALNDSSGHQQGDDYLMALGKELAQIAKRPADIAARIGGEEFALMLPETDDASAMQIAETARLAVASLGLPHPASSAAKYLTVSAGVATATLQGWITPADLIAAADRALYEAKRAGRNRVIAAERRNLFRFLRVQVERECRQERASGAACRGPQRAIFARWGGRVP